MTNDAILSLLSQMNYGCILIDTSEQRVKFGPTEAKWRQDLADANENHRSLLVAKLHHWQRDLLTK